MDVVTLPNLLNGSSTMDFEFDLIKSDSMGLLDCVSSSTYLTS